MSSRTLVAVLLLAALALAALLVRGRGRERGETPAAESTGAHTASVSAPETTRIEAPAPSADLPEPAGSARAEIAAGSSAERDHVTETVVIAVVDRADAPVAGAEIRWRAREGGRRASARPLHAALASSPAQARTDAEGLARIAVPRARAVEVLALAQGSVGETVVDAPPPSTARERHGRIVLLPDWDLPVEVVDETLRPVPGVTVVCERDAVRGAWSEATDAHGIATFRHAGFELERASARRLTVRLDAPLALVSEAHVEQQPPHGAPVRLVLAAGGSVEVRVLHADGSPVPDGTEVTLSAVRFASSGRPQDSVRAGPGIARLPTHAGRVLFERVGLGLSLTLDSKAADRIPSRLTGPQRPGERVNATLFLRREPAVLVFRARGESGDPVTGTLDAGVRITTGGLDNSSRKDVRAGDDGRFEVEVEPVLVEGEQRVLEICARGGALAGRVDVSRDFPPGRTDMGDMILHPVPLVVAGRVVDDSGGPVSGATLVATQPDGAELFQLRTARTADDGEFALYGATRVTSVRLSLHHAQLRAEPLEVSVGSPRVEIVARAGGSVVGRLLVDPGIALGGLSAVLRSEDGGEHQVSFGSSRRSVIDGEGTFQLEDLPLGLHTFAVQAGYEVLAEFPDVAVVSGEITRDPRLAAIDLRGHLHTFTFELATPSAAVVSGTVSYTPAGARSPEFEELFRGSPVTLTTRLEAIDVTVRASGWRIERLSNPSERTEVRLRHALDVRLALPPGVRLPAPPLFVRATLAWGYELWPDQARSFDEHGTIACKVDEPGLATVTWFAERRGEGGRSTSLLDLPAQTIVVEDRDGEQRFELAVTNETLAAALAAR